MKYFRGLSDPQMPRFLLLVLQCLALSVRGGIFPRSLAQGTRASVGTGFCVFLAFSSSSAAQALYSDEVSVKVKPRTGGDELYLGVSLVDADYRGSTRCVVGSVKADAPSNVRSLLGPGMVLSSINGKNVEGYKREEVAKRIKEIKAPVELIFRDPNLLFQRLNSTTNQDIVLTSMILPPSKGADKFPAQVLRVERLEVPAIPRGGFLPSAAVGDVLEVSYRVETLEPTVNAPGTLLQGSDPAGIILPAKSKLSDLTQFFVLGTGTKTPFPQELIRPEVLLLLRGMVVGELRRIDLPALLSQGTGLRLDLRLVSINGVV